MKNKAKYTSGPWFVNRDSSGIKSEDFFICSVENRDSDKRRLHDLKLIAAAPELLEALETLLEAYVHENEGHDEITDIAIAAIQKAKGENNAKA